MPDARIVRTLFGVVGQEPTVVEYAAAISSSGLITSWTRDKARALVLVHQCDVVGRFYAGSQKDWRFEDVAPPEPTAGVA